MLIILELALTHTCANRVGSMLSQILQLVGARDSSPTIMTTGPAFPPALGVNGLGGYFFPTHVTKRLMGNGYSSPMVTVLGLTHPHLHQQGCVNQ